MVLLTILIPAFNEAATVGEAIRRVIAVPTELLGFEKEIIVCDDGSTDDTQRVAAAQASEDERVRVLVCGRNRGKGYAIRRGLAEARGEICVIHDADLEYDPVSHMAMLACMRGGAEAVYGSRFLERHWPRRMAPANFVANRILTVTANLLLRTHITDEATCLKMVRTNLLRSLELRADGFDFCPELTAKLALAGIRIHEIPAAYEARNAYNGKKIRWFHGVEALRVLIQQSLRASDAAVLPHRLRDQEALRQQIGN